MTSTLVRQCRRCAKAMASYCNQSVPARDRHARRGLCGACANTLNGTDELLDYERSYHRWDEVLGDLHAVRARDPQITRAKAAQQLGMTVAALDQAILRARHRGVRWTWPRTQSTKERAT